MGILMNRSIVCEPTPEWGSEVYFLQDTFSPIWLRPFIEGQLASGVVLEDSEK